MTTYLTRDLASDLALQLSEAGFDSDTSPLEGDHFSVLVRDPMVGSGLLGIETWEMGQLWLDENRSKLRVLSFLAQARSYVQGRESSRGGSPWWPGERLNHDAQYAGVTNYSLALWAARRQQLLGQVDRLECRFTADKEQVVRAMPAQGEVALLAFYGFAWGYGGEGPHGLAIVVQDLWPGLFPLGTVFDREMAAVRMIAAQPGDRSFTISAAGIS